jgi:hypothetical protein
MSNQQLQALILSLGNVWADKYHQDDHTTFQYPHTSQATVEAEGEEYPYTYEQEDESNTMWYSI